MTTQYDINDQIEDGEAFNGCGGAHQRWKEYAKKSLGTSASDDEESQTNTNSNSDSSPVERKKQGKKGKKAKVDAVSMVSHTGKAWIGDIKNASLDVMKHMVRGFITFHYRNGGMPQDPVEVDSDGEGASQRRTAAKGKGKTAPDHQPMDTKESEDDQGGPTDKEEPGDVSPEPGAGSEHVDMGKQARGRGLQDEGSEEEEADGRRWTWSEVVCNPKDSSAYQARNKVRERDSNGKDGREAQKPIVKPRPGRSRQDSSALPKSRQVGSEQSGVNSDMAGAPTHRTEDRPAGKGKRQVAGAKPGPSMASGTKGQNARRVPRESQERLDNDIYLSSDKQQRRPKQTQRVPTQFPEESPQVALADKRKRK
ncbi:hypothetical protein PAXRUDRAFT_21333 [Paxillus rubicundulus Ve08.2h10]|uniref:Uncharacterized protein n=1 Tax=Paxillus rubicundulus Ve08.2h10 TaxID=930991 RepID=A0A0D0CZU1_9AGAM|nr:hypothetical protein PAXRUDRAFT_21333 [Paxillus rubicundulus Ve08.2h10]